MKTYRSTCDPAYLQWQAQFAAFEAGCFEGLSEFVRARFDDLLDRFDELGHESLGDFPARGRSSAISSTSSASGPDSARSESVPPGCAALHT